MKIHDLKNLIEGEVFDFNQLNAALNHYAHPRGKISQWLKTGELIRVKKGLYVFGRNASSPYSIEVLANLIYGPSAISLNYALSYYGLIPEAVYTVTSITNKRHKAFATPVGNFTYTYLATSKYSIGIQLKTLPSDVNILIASPEKAFCDLISLSIKNVHIMNEEAVADFLFNDLRIDEEAFKQLSMSDLQQIADVYHNPRLNRIIKYTKLWMKNNA